MVAPNLEPVPHIWDGHSILRGSALGLALRSWPNREIGAMPSACNAPSPALASGLEPVPYDVVLGPGPPCNQTSTRRNMTSIHRRFTAPLAVLAAAGLALAGCSGGGGGGGAGDAGDADGVVTVYGTIQDTEAELLEESWAQWEEDNAIDIQYEGSKEFEAQISVRAQGGNAPDLAIFPQPGLLADLAVARLHPAGARGVACQRRRVLVRGLGRLRHGRRHPLRRAAHGERQGLRLVLAGRVRGERLGGPRRPGTTCSR